MAGIDDKGHKVDVACDWTLEPCPRNFLSDDLLSGNSNLGCSAEVVKLNSSCDPVQKVEDLELEVSADPFSRPNDVFSFPKRATQGAFAERMATRPGFSPLKIDTEQIKPAGFPGSSTDARSPYVTIPPGLSPTTLLDSPVFLVNSLVQPSPTTGKLSFGMMLDVNSTSTSGSADVTKGSSAAIENETFAFKPLIGSNFSSLQTASNMGDATCDTQHPLTSLAASVNQDVSNHSGRSVDASEPPCLDQKKANLQHEFHESSDRKYHSDDTVFNMKSSEPTAGNEQSLPDRLEGDVVKDDSSSAGLGQPSDDGYNWRKYGQKQVKGSEYPRSYYKCTHPNCEVKKKVERSPEGVVTEIIYKGSHIHSKPPPSRRACTPVQKFDEMQMDAPENLDLQPNVESRQLGESLQNGTTCSDWRNASNDVPSSASFAADFGDPSLQTQSSPGFESADAVDVSSTISNDEEDLAAQGSLSLGGGEEDESESKRRKLDTAVMDLSTASRAVREPRVVVQTTSEVDILDDGYRWRKYGQKVVKGNPNPRSYYKCTSAGCNVRKHVERAAHDLKSVITTYEGKHNHEVPAARNSAAANSTVSGNVTSAMSQSHGMPKRPPEFSHMQDSYSNFVVQPALGVYGIPGREQLGPSAASFSFGLGQQGLSTLPMPTLVPGSTVKMLPPMHPYLGSHQPVTDAGFVIPKQLDSIADTDLQTSQQFINR